MSVVVPVFLIDRFGDRGTDNVNCSPCIDVVVAGAGLAVKAVAMLDSGAAAMYADPEVIRKTNLPVVGTDTFFAVGHSAATTIHEAIVWIDGLQDVNRRCNGTPYGLPKGTPASGCIWSARVGPELSI